MSSWRKEEREKREEREKLGYCRQGQHQTFVIVQLGKRREREWRENGESEVVDTSIKEREKIG